MHLLCCLSTLSHIPGLGLQVSQQKVLQQNAYMLFYARETPFRATDNGKNGEVKPFSSSNPSSSSALQSLSSTGLSSTANATRKPTPIPPSTERENKREESTGEDKTLANRTENNVKRKRKRKRKNRQRLENTDAADNINVAHKERNEREDSEDLEDSVNEERMTKKRKRISEEAEKTERSFFRNLSDRIGEGIVGLASSSSVPCNGVAHAEGDCDQSTLRRKKKRLKIELNASTTSLSAAASRAIMRWDDSSHSNGRDGREFKNPLSTSLLGKGVVTLMCFHV